MNNKVINAKIINPFFDESYIVIDFEWFTICDRNCSYCYNVANGKKRYNKSTEYIKSVLLKLLKMDYDNILISILGGEILLSPDFNDIIDFIRENCKPTHKFVLFTHGQHSPEFFREKMSSILPFKEQFRIIQSLHFEDIKKKNFEENALYLNDNFPTVSYVVFLDDLFVKNFKWFESLLEKTQNILLEPLTFDYDGVLTPNIEENIKKSLNLLKKYLFDLDERSEMYYIINGKRYNTITAKYFLQKTYNYKFTGVKCTIREYEIRENGDVFAACSPAFGKILNINTCSMQELNEKIRKRETICKLQNCEPNVYILDIQGIIKK